jgi:2-methylisocitrate lyase-like PEP mutase family enzyme
MCVAEKVLNVIVCDTELEDDDMTKSERMREKLLDIFNSGEKIVLLGVGDALQAKLAEKMGIKAVVVGSYSVSACYLQKPDIGLVTMEEMLGHIRHVVDAVDIPVCADGQTGFGNALNVARTVREYEKAGAAAIQLDLLAEEACAWVGVPLSPLPIEESVIKLRSAIEARDDQSFSIYTHCNGQTIEEKVQRTKAYFEAGAAMVGPPGFDPRDTSWEELRLFAKAVREQPWGKGKPLKCTQQAYLRNIVPTVKDFGEMGYQVMAFATDLLYASLQAQKDYLEQLTQTGSNMGFFGRMMPHQEFLDLVGQPQIKAYGEKYMAYAKATMKSLMK